MEHTKPRGATFELKRLRDYREHAGLRQANLEARANVSTGTVSPLELGYKNGGKGRIIPARASLQIARSLAAALGVMAIDLVGFKDRPEALRRGWG